MVFLSVDLCREKEGEMGVDLGFSFRRIRRVYLFLAANAFDDS